jgi:hypothetical protein
MAAFRVDVDPSAEEWMRSHITEAARVGAYDIKR